MGEMEKDDNGPYYPPPWVATRLFVWTMGIIKGDRNSPKQTFVGIRFFNFP